MLIADGALSSHFHSYFSVESATSRQLREEVFQLRYNVFCEEFGYEDKNRFRDQMERDIYDNHSRHFLIRHRISGNPAGCIRIILSTPDERRPLPFEQVCNGQLDPGYYPPAEGDSVAYAEISRLAVHSSFRKRAGEATKANGLGSTATRANGDGSERAYPLVAMGLYLTATAMTICEDLRYAYVMMEPRTARMLRRCGIRFTQISELVEYHGKRAAYVVKPNEVPEQLNPEARELLESINIEAC